MPKSFLAALLLAAASLSGQTPAFEVASIKPSQPVTPAMVASGTLHIGMKIDAARADIGFFGLMQLICKAYDVKPYQVNGPSWLASGQKFDIVATLPAGATKEQVPLMLRALLAERFKLKLHQETKDTPVYAMVVAKSGLKMTPSATAPAADPDAPKTAATGSSSVSIAQTSKGATVSDGEGTQQKMSMGPDGKSMHLEISNVTTAKLAESLSPMVDRPIVDLTGLTGKYDVNLDIAMADLMNAARAAGANVPASAPGGAASGGPADAASDSGGSVFTAIQAAGLKLEPRKSPLAMIVIESVEKMPTEN